MPRKPHDKLPSSPHELEGLTKAAVLLLAVGPEKAGVVLAKMPPEAVEEVMRELASLGRAPPELIAGVVEEFYGLTIASQYAREGNVDYARAVLSKSLDPKDADRMVQQIQTQVQKTPFSFLQRAESENLLTFIQDEHPQTIALILCHLPHHKAAEILAGLPLQKQLEVVKRIANMEQTNPEVIKEVERGLESRLANMLMQSMEKAGGVDTVAEVLNLADRATEKSIMEGLEAEDPDLVEQIRRLMFVFEDILLVNDKGIQAVLKEVDNDELALALKTASPELQEKIFTNMSQRAAALIKEDMEFMGPVRVSDVEAAQQRIVDVVRRLEEAGEVLIQGRGGEAEMVV
ncbi:MAG: flagellar motor switch protein FliG [Leptolyngbya sp. PLA2]|nr:flagellar motor switch protein FliG [Leptolyngbya sp.]MCE7971574.1 flagellar motor switch protein FliG [Leptolyngbya sp. PL-A2]MCZ7632608.1 flagellar motor switch protein FliG [Phycisphaerales bacterium]MDL1904937.1 flagellar motor switch protein FliG [Synechococcales cyanobacterium CNB]GIK19836.1 MAG: flagellar motor switch protein FliG [Planctomycetota bacterium]